MCACAPFPLRLGFLSLPSSPTGMSPFLGVAFFGRAPRVKARGFLGMRLQRHLASMHVQMCRLKARASDAHKHTHTTRCGNLWTSSICVVNVVGGLLASQGVGPHHANSNGEGPNLCLQSDWSQSFGCYASCARTQDRERIAARHTYGEQQRHRTDLLLVGGHWATLWGGM